jgi:hypothetical protein
MRETFTTEHDERGTLKAKSIISKRLRKRKKKRSLEIVVPKEIPSVEHTKNDSTEMLNHASLRKNTEKTISKGGNSSCFSSSNNQKLI